MLSIFSKANPRIDVSEARPKPLAPAAHGLLQAVKDAGVSDDQLLDTALKAVDKLADAFEVRDGNIDDCF